MPAAVTSKARFHAGERLVRGRHAQHPHHRHLEQPQQHARGVQRADDAPDHVHLRAAPARRGDEVEGGLVAERGAVQHHLARRRLGLRERAQQRGLGVEPVAPLVERLEVATGENPRSSRQRPAMCEVSRAVADHQRAAAPGADVALVDAVQQPQAQHAVGDEEGGEGREHGEPRLDHDGRLERERREGGDDQGDQAALGEGEHVQRPRDVGLELVEAHPEEGDEDGQRARWGTPSPRRRARSAAPCRAPSRRPRTASS